MEGVVSCPNCGAQVIFRSPALPVRVCDYCRTMVLRQGEGIEAVGTAAVLPFDVSPIQIGTTGRLDDHPFDVIGRVRWRWSDGAWNEWLMLFADGSYGWLGEAMGQFMALRERPIGDVRTKMIRTLIAGGQVVAGQEGEIDGVSYEVSDVKQASCVAAEGELPFKAPAGWTIRNVDFRNDEGGCASFQHDGEAPSFYTGRYVTLDELKPGRLRVLEGWRLPGYAA